MHLQNHVDTRLISVIILYLNGLNGEWWVVIGVGWDNTIIMGATKLSNGDVRCVKIPIKLLLES